MRIIVSHALIQAIESARQQVLKSLDIVPNAVNLAAVEYHSNHVHVIQLSNGFEDDVMTVDIRDDTVIRILALYIKLARIFGPVILAFKRCIVEADEAIDECKQWFEDTR